MRIWLPAAPLWVIACSPMLLFPGVSCRSQPKGNTSAPAASPTTAAAPAASPPGTQSKEETGPDQGNKAVEALVPSSSRQSPPSASSPPPTAVPNRVQPSPPVAVPGAAQPAGSSASGGSPGAGGAPGAATKRTALGLPDPITGYTSWFRLEQGTSLSGEKPPHMLARQAYIQLQKPEDFSPGKTLSTPLTPGSIIILEEKAAAGDFIGRIAVGAKDGT